MIQFLLDGTNLINPAVFTCTWVGCTNWERKYCSKYLCTLLILGVDVFHCKSYSIFTTNDSQGGWRGRGGYRGHHGSPLKGRGAIEGAMGVNLRGGGAIVGVIGLHLRGGG